jgi:hypothetical protein
VFILLFINLNSQTCSQTPDWSFGTPDYPVASMKITKDDQTLIYSIRNSSSNLITKTAFMTTLETNPTYLNFGSG